MSQRTRARTTGATPRPSKRAIPEPAPSAAPDTTDSAPPATPPSEAHTLSPAELVRALRAVARELEHDPALAQRVALAMAPPADARDAKPDEGSLAAPEMAAEPDAPADLGRVRAFRPRIIAGTSPELGTGVPDPYALAARLGEQGLRAALAELRLGTLRAIVREHKLDSTGHLTRLNDGEKLRALILEQVLGAERT